MADEIIRMEDIYADDIVGNINEVREARGTFESLDARLDNIGGGNAPSPSTSDPAMDGTASPGSADTYSRGDHVHPTDTSRQAVIDSSHKLSSDLVDDTNNTHKFATAAQLQQISTNENNILNCVKVYPDIIGWGVNCDANSLSDNTLYRLQTDSVTNFPTDYPTTGALYYIVTIKNTYSGNAQRYQYIFNNEMKPKWRRSQSQGWSAWSDILTSDDVIKCGSGKQYTRLRDAVAAGVLAGRTVIVYPGTYDLTSEFASELAAETGSAGIALGNGVHIIFMAGAYVTANLDGSSAWAYDNFQPFYSTGSFTLENAHIIASNTRYCVHNEHGRNSTPYTAKFINCHMEYTNSRQNVKYVQCIGGGLGLHGNILIDGGFYKSSTEYGYSSYGSYGTAQNCQQPISYHNSSLAGADSKIVIRNVYLADRGYFRFGNHGSSTMLSNIEISGCSVGLPTMNMFETVDDVAMNLSFVLYNNTIRNNAVPFDFSRLIGLYENGEYNESALLPSEYQQIAYLRSTGTQYIDTGIKPSGNDRISMTAQFTSINSSGSDTAFGARDSANVNAFVFGAVGAQGGYFEIAYGTNGFTTYGTMVSDTVRHNFAIDAGKGYVDTNVCNDYTAQTFDCNFNIFVFARNQAGSMQEGTGANLKVYGYRHYKNGALSAHLVPCQRKSDNVLGMYDLVNDVFLTNAGTGEFSAS